MTTDLAVRATSIDELKEQVRLIETTDFVPKALRGNKHAILACVLYGREIGLQPMESLAEIHMIDGRPSLSAKGKLKRAREAGHSITGGVEGGVATVIGKRADNGDTMTVTFSLDEAKAAGLLSKTNWQRHEQDMLWARAVSRLCRSLFDDIPGVLMLDPDEAEITPEEYVDAQVGQAFTPPTETSVGEDDTQPTGDSDTSSPATPVEEALFEIPESARRYRDDG
jgi:hypothetical protein